MSWVRIDDQIWSHPKVLKAGRDVLGFWVCAASYAASRHSSTGFFATEFALSLAPTEVWSRLHEAGLIDPAEGGWTIHDYAEWNPPARAIAKREARASAGRAGGIKSGASRRSKRGRVEAESGGQNEANAKQTRSKAEANAKQTVLEVPESIGAIEANEAPVPVPVPCSPTENPPKPPLGVVGSASPETNKPEPSAVTGYLHSDKFGEDCAGDALRNVLYAKGVRAYISRPAGREISLHFKRWFPGQNSQDHFDTVTNWAVAWASQPDVDLVSIRHPKSVFLGWCAATPGCGQPKPFVPYHQPAVLPPEPTAEEREALRIDGATWNIAELLGVAS